MYVSIKDRLSTTSIRLCPRLPLLNMVVCHAPMPTHSLPIRPFVVCRLSVVRFLRLIAGCFDGYHAGGGGRSSFAAPLASSQRVPGSTPGAALHLELLVTPLPLNLHKFSAEGCYTEVPAPNLIIVD